MVEAVEAVRDRLLRASAALEKAGVPYVVVGGNAVAAWVSRVDRTAVRNTQDVDIMVRRSDFPAVRIALESAGFIHQDPLGVVIFRDGPQAGPRDAVHIVFANERVQLQEALPNPDIDRWEMAESYRIIALEDLVRIKLTSYRLKDRVHLQDLLAVGLIDATWIERIPRELVDRFREVLANPNA